MPKSKPRNNKKKNSKQNISAAQQRRMNLRREALQHPSGQYTEDEKAAFVGHCVLDLVAAVSMLEQEDRGDEPTVPKGILLPDGYLDDPATINEAFDTLTKRVERVNKQDIQHLGCVTCCNTMKINLDTGEIGGRENGCQKYYKTPVDFRESQ